VLPFRLALAGVAVLVVRSALTNRSRVAWFLVLAPLDLGLSANALLPRVPVTVYSEESAFVRTAASLGRVYERAGKDLDGVRRGTFGAYPSNDVRHLIASGAAQGWALTGAPHGMTYAYNNDSDGSYTWRNDIASERLENVPWRERLKWLRAAGVAGIIAYRLPKDLGVTPVLRTTGPGVPNTLYRVDSTLPDVRRYSHTAAVASAAEGVRHFEDPRFDPAASLVVEAPTPLNANDPLAAVSEVAFHENELKCRTQGAKPGYVFIARSFSARAKATVDGAPVRVFPANVHLIARPVPPGDHHVDLQF
jgi:hypothetical protein